MKKIFFAIISILLLQNCISIRSCDKLINGKYYAKNNTETIIYLDLKNDGTFYHYFKNQTNEFSHFGTWEISKDGYCKIEFSEWENYNKDGVDFHKHIDGMTLFINGNSLDYTPDGSNSKSYRRIK
jgi:hypothetical protein